MVRWHLRARSSGQVCSDRDRTDTSKARRSYDDVPVAIGGVQRGELKPGDVLVLRGCGPKGGPAMAGSASRVVFAIYAAGLESDVAFVSDGQLSGLCNKGMTTLGATESAIGGPLALVENGDRIRIDLDARTLDLDVPVAELDARRARRATCLPQATGYLSIYQRSVQPMSTGAYWSFPNGSRLSD